MKVFKSIVIGQHDFSMINPFFNPPMGHGRSC